MIFLCKKAVFQSDNFLGVIVFAVMHKNLEEEFGNAEKSIASSIANVPTGGNNKET